MPGGDTFSAISFAFDLGVDFGAEQQRDVGEPQPDEQDDGGSEGAVGDVESS